MRIYSKQTRNWTLGAISYLLGEMSKSPSLLEFVLKESDLILLVTPNFMFSISTLIVAPRSVESYDRIVFQWHDLVSSFCKQRQELFTDQQSKIQTEILRLENIAMSGGIARLISTAFDAEHNGVQKHSPEMHSILESAEIESARVQLDTNIKIESLKAKYELMDSSGEYEEGFRRSVLSRNERSLVFIDLISPIEMQEKCYGFMTEKCFIPKYSAKRGLRLAHTKRPHKHAKAISRNDVAAINVMRQALGIEEWGGEEELMEHWALGEVDVAEVVE